MMDACYDYQDRDWPALVAFLEDARIPFAEINAGRPIEQVCEAVRAAIDPFFAFRLAQLPRLVTEEEVPLSI